MAGLKDIKKRIGSVRKTQQITRAMKMVAAAKLRRAQERILAARPYSYRLYTVLNSLAARVDRSAHPLLAERAIETLGVVVMTSDRGLCGAFNGNILKYAERHMRDGRARHGDVKLIAIGRKGADYFVRRRYALHRSYVRVLDSVDYMEAAGIGRALVDDFLDGTYDALDLVYNEFKSALQQRITVERLLPIKTGGEAQPDAVREEWRVRGEGAGGVDFIYEPDRKAILDALLPRHLQIQIYRSLLESSASEHGARMSAMDNATKNAADMIGGLTLQYNRARQAAITKELMEIVGGKEALEQ